MAREAAAMSLNQWKQIMCYLAMIICWSLNINVRVRIDRRLGRLHTSPPVYSWRRPLFLFALLQNFTPPLPKRDRCQMLNRDTMASASGNYYDNNNKKADYIVAKSKAWTAVFKIQLTGRFVFC